MLELIGLQEDLVKRTCERILDGQDGGDLSSTAVIFPSRRFGFFLRQELAAGRKDNFFPPLMLPIEAFFESLFKLNFPGCRILDDLEAAHAVYESAKTVFATGMYGSKRIGDFPTFLPWAQQVLAALEEIQSEGGETKTINWDSYKEFAQLGEYHRPYKEFIQSIPSLLDHLRQSLRRRRQASQGMVWRDVADLAEKGELQVQPARRWIFSGFNAMNACEKKLFHFIADRHEARLILRTDPKGMNDPLTPFHLQAETIASLGMTQPGELPESSPWDDLAARVTIQPCEGVESEAYHAFRILQEICRGRDEASLRRVAVLLPSAPSLIPFVQGAVSRFDQDENRIPFNITLGYPLERTPIMQLVDSLLTVLEKIEDGSVAAGDYLQLVRHPYVKISGSGGDAEPLKRGIHLLENIISDGNLTRFSMEKLEAKLGAELQRPLPEIDGELAAAIRTEVRALHDLFIPLGITDVPTLLAFLRRVLERVGSQANREAHLFLNEYAAAALDALEELEEFAASHEGTFQAASASSLAALVRAHFRGRTIRFEGSPLQGVQVMGPLEFRGLRFDEVIVLDALEGILPGSAKYDPILPADIRAIFKIRDHGDWEKIYAFNFFAMLGSAGHVHILYPRQSEDGQERERSRFIERIAYAAEKKAVPPPPAVPRSLPFAIVPRGLKTAKKDQAVCLRLEALRLSPSSLETYVKCPLQFYFSRVLGLKERAEVAIETEDGLIGTIAHAALQDFYERYPEAGAMAKAGDEKLDADMAQCVHKAFRALNFDPEKGVERIRSWALLEQLCLFVREDRQRLETSGTRVEKREKALAADITVPGLDLRISIQGRLDRLEREKGVLRVIDYKTGGPFPPQIRLDNALDLKDLCQRDEKGYFDALAAFRKKYPGMQVLIYLVLLAGEQVKAWDELDAAYVFLREKGGKMVQNIFRTGGRNPRPFSGEEKKLAMEAFVKDLEEVLRDLYGREHFLPNPGDERICGWCPFRLPCGNL